MATNAPISQDPGNPYTESDIRYNYSNPLQIIAAANWNNYSGVLNTQPQFYSSDGGDTWAQTSLPTVGEDLYQFDPGVGWTSDGTAWAIACGAGGGEGTRWKLRCFKSINGGADWKHDSDISGTQTAADRPLLWVDHSLTATRDNMYAIWHENANAFVSVREGPAGTWSAPLQVSGAETTFTACGGDIKTNSAGDAFAFWPNAGGQTLLVVKSTNGGTSFDALGPAPVQIATTYGKFRIAVPAQATRSCAIYVSGGAYKTATVDMVYCCWADLAGGGGCNDPADAPGSDVSSQCKTRVWFAFSDDGGANWQTAVKLNDQPSLNDQFFPRLVVDETNGNLMVVYYDTVNDPARLSTDVWMQCSTDNGGNWSDAVKITSAESDEATLGNDDQYGDYIGLTGYAGQYFACWTDRRGGGSEAIWGSPISIPSSYFIVVKNNFGADEVTDSPSYSNDFYVAVEGASPNSLGPSVPTLSNAFTAVASISANISGGPLPFPTYELPTQLDTPQRIVFPYNVSFPSGATIPPFPAAGSSPVLEELDSSITLPGLTLAAPATLFELVSGEDPYFANVDPAADNEFYRSQDLRVFTITPGVPSQGNAMPGAPPFTPTVVGGTPIAFTSQDPTAGYNYIQDLIGFLNISYGNPMGPDPFASLLDQGNFLTADSTVSPATQNPSDPAHPFINYNFAIARVRLTGETNVSAPHVRVFFRLFIAETYDTSYQPSTTYPSTTDAAGLPRTPLPGVDNETYPFFATGDYSTAAETSDYGPSGVNNQTMAILSTDAGGVWAYFGCFLNVYDSSIQGAVAAAGTHQCLVAQIAYDGAPIESTSSVTMSPENSDKLAQRNLQITFSDNPGPASTHRIPQAFDTKPSPVIARTSGKILHYPDELMISWGNTPAGSLVSIYWPQVDANSVLQLATRLYASNFLFVADLHTLGCRVTGPVTYVPIPSGRSGSFAGLITVTLPPTVVDGDEFNISVHRIATRRDVDSRIPPPPLPINAAPGDDAVIIKGAGNWRYIAGSFQIRIPVSTKEVMLWPEQNTLAVFKWRLQRLAISNRWYPVLQRHTEIIAGRLKGLGGNPNQIGPSISGFQPPVHGDCEEKGQQRHEFTGKVVAIVYDRFGEFRGFRLITTDGSEKSFRGRERDVESLVYRAWQEEILITVQIQGDEHWPSSITYRTPHRFLADPNE